MPRERDAPGRRYQLGCSPVSSALDVSTHYWMQHLLFLVLDLTRPTPPPRASENAYRTFAVGSSTI